MVLMKPASPLQLLSLQVSLELGRVKLASKLLPTFVSDGPMTFDLSLPPSQVLGVRKWIIMYQIHTRSLCVFLTLTSQDQAFPQPVRMATNVRVR